MDFLIQGLLPRIPLVERINGFTFDTYIHPHRDAGIYKEADDFLRPFVNTYSYAIVMMDHF